MRVVVPESVKEVKTDSIGGKGADPMVGYAIRSAKRRSGARWGTGKGNQAANARRGIRLLITAQDQ